MSAVSQKASVSYHEEEDLSKASEMSQAEILFLRKW